MIVRGLAASVVVLMMAVVLAAAVKAAPAAGETPQAFLDAIYKIMGAIGIRPHDIARAEVVSAVAVVVCVLVGDRISDGSHFRPVCLIFCVNRSVYLPRPGLGTPIDTSHLEVPITAYAVF